MFGTQFELNEPIESLFICFSLLVDLFFLSVKNLMLLRLFEHSAHSSSVYLIEATVQAKFRWNQQQSNFNIYIIYDKSEIEVYVNVAMAMEQ